VESLIRAAALVLSPSDLAQLDSSSDARSA